MKVREYLEAKYLVKKPTTLSSSEAKVFRVPYPLASGWLRAHGDREITLEMARAALAVEQRHMDTRGNKVTRAKWAARGVEILKTYIRGLELKPRAADAPLSDAFLQSYEWRRVRMQALKKFGPRCQACGASPKDGRVMHVDHIKPRRIFPELALEVDNLQILCDLCNHGKGNWDMTDWREEAKA